MRSLLFNVYCVETRPGDSRCRGSVLPGTQHVPQETPGQIEIRLDFEALGPTDQARRPQSIGHGFKSRPPYERALMKRLIARVRALLPVGETPIRLPKARTSGIAPRGSSSPAWPSQRWSRTPAE